MERYEYQAASEFGKEDKEEITEKQVKSVQSAFSDLSVPLNVYSPSAIIGFSLLNSILMAHFLKLSFAQTCLKEMDNGKLHQFNY